MNMKLIVLLTLAIAVVGCDSSKPAPKPVTWKATVTPEQAKKIAEDAEARQPCSEENLKKATQEQRQKCDPTRGMFGGLRQTSPAVSNARQKQQSH
jgi:hypothetical protein